MSLNNRMKLKHR